MNKVLIVGAGIGGITLAQVFAKNNWEVTIVDNPSLPSASEVAAGMMNPLVFKRMLFCWNGYESFHHSVKYYQKLEKEWATTFLRGYNMAKLMHADHEKEMWREKCKTHLFNEFLQSDIINDYKKDILHPFSAGNVSEIYQLNTSKYLDLALTHLNGEVIRTYFDHTALQTHKENLIWEGRSFDHVVFAEGSYIQNNPFFNYLPFKFTKGELILIEGDFDFKEVIKKNIFIVPFKDNQYWVGATYDWKSINFECTETGRENLKEKLKTILKVPFKIIDQKAGVRPTVSDRRPYIGTHSDYKNIHVFNGLGTRGVMYAPGLAQSFYAYLSNNKALPKEVNISRINLPLQN